MGKHSAAIVPIRLGVVQQNPKEIPEYRSEDIQFDWAEAYVPPFPITDAERRLQELNRAEKEASMRRFINETTAVVNEELSRGQRPSP